MILVAASSILSLINLDLFLPRILFACAVAGLCNHRLHRWQRHRHCRCLTQCSCDRQSERANGEKVPTKRQRQKKNNRLETATSEFFGDKFVLQYLVNEQFVCFFLLLEQKMRWENTISVLCQLQRAILSHLFKRLRFECSFSFLLLFPKFTMSMLAGSSWSRNRTEQLRSTLKVL